MGINDLSVGVGKSKYLDRNEDWKGQVLGCKEGRDRSENETAMWLVSCLVNSTFSIAVIVVIVIVIIIIIIIIIIFGFTSILHAGMPWTVFKKLISKLTYL